MALVYFYLKDLEKPLGTLECEEIAENIGNILYDENGKCKISGEPQPYVEISKNLFQLGADNDLNLSFEHEFNEIRVVDRYGVLARDRKEDIYSILLYLKEKYGEVSYET